MDSKRFSVFNKSRQAYLSDEVRIVDAVLEPLKVLKVLIEGLDTDIASGLWLTHFKGVPVARTLSPFDLIYLDKDYRVVHCVELTTDSDFAPFKGLPESALVLPSQSIASTDTRNGDQLILRFAQQVVPEPAARPAIPTPAPQISPGSRSLRDLSPSSRFSNISFPAPPVQAPNLPLNTFIGSHQAAASRGAPATAQRSVPAEPQAGISPIRTSPVPVMPQALPIDRRSPEIDTESSALSSPVTQSRVVKPAKRRAPIPIHPITEKPAVPRYLPSEVDERPSLPQQGPPPAAVPNAPALAAQAASPIVSVPSVQPPASSPALAPEPSIFKTKPKRAPGPPAPFTDYKNVLLPQAEEEELPSRTIRFLRWIFPDLNIERPQRSVDRRHAMRLPMPELIAYFFTGGAPQPHKLHDISVTGFYLQTEERWIPGTIIRMTLQRIGSRGDDPGDTLTVHSRVVRWGPDGGGFEFVFSGFLD